MTKEDYSKYYIQCSDHYLIPKDIFDELFCEMENWKQDTQKYKEVIDKAIEYIKNPLIEWNYLTIEELLDILKEVE